MELVVQTTLPVMTSNMAEVKNQLLEGIKKYEIEVTEENLSEAKKMATELNKLSSVINKVKSEKITQVSGPIEEFKTQVAELVEICQTGRQKILDQVKVFEDRTRGKVKELIAAEFLTQFNERGIRVEFRQFNADDFMNISFLTKTGNLSKGAKDSVSAKVAECRALQDKVDMRLLQLENVGLKAGLKSPLRKEHVESFLTLPDDQYEIQLSKLVGIEVQRQVETEAKFKSEQAAKPVRFFRCSVCGHIVTDYEMPAICPKCPSKGFREFPSLREAQTTVAPAQTTQELPKLPIPAAGPVPVHQVVIWDQERLHQLRGHLGDDVFFTMFKIVYQPISDIALSNAISRRPELGEFVQYCKGGA